MFDFRVWICSLLLVLYASESHGLANCIQCATDNLKDAWYITGFADGTKFNDPKYFSSSACTDANSLKTPQLTVACTTNCLAYGFYAYDAQGNNNQYIVRGCQDTLTGVKIASLTADRCEVGTGTGYDNKDVAQQQQTFTQICSSADNCNTRLDFTTATACNTNLYNSVQTASSVNCVQCGPGNDNCVTPTSKCQGTWCRKYTVTINSQTRYMHDCQPTNPYGQPTCATATSTGVQFPGQGNVNYQQTVCYCVGDNCNGAVNVLRTRWSLAAVLGTLVFAGAKMLASD